jgi:serine/threonine protein phosphatase PrpC
MAEEPVFPGTQRPERVEWRRPVLEVAGLTDVGLVRGKNEDSFLIADPEKVDVSRGILLAVADGMGGHVAGEVASQTAIDFLSTFYSDEPVPESPESHLARKVIQANETLLELAQFTPVLEGMGTTLTAAVIVDGGHLAICHVGDSRIYLLRNGSLESQSNDHSFVGEQVRLGLLTEAEARVHPARNIITRALGIRQTVEPDLMSLDLKPGDRILLSTDGLHGYVEDDPIRQVLTEAPCASEACARLVNLALDAGGPDNVTVVVAYVWETDRLIERLNDNETDTATLLDVPTLPGVDLDEK